MGGLVVKIVSAPRVETNCKLLSVGAISFDGIALLEVEGVGGELELGARSAVNT